MEHKTRTKALSWLLSLAMLFSLVPGMSLTAYAAPTEELLTTITAVGSSDVNPATSANVSYSTEGVATLTFSGSVAYQASPAWGWWGYGWTATVNAAEGYTITKCIFYDDANRTATDSEAPFVVETTEEDKTPRINGTPIDGGNSQSKGLKKIEVYGYATPAVEPESTYTLTIPSTLTVADKGWNATDGISATGTLASGKKLTVTAASANGWALKQQGGSETVSYTMKETSDGAAKNAWEFTTLPGSATLGIDVSDYSTKPAGTYQDTVTFTAAVKDNLVSFTIKRDVNSNSSGNYTVVPGTTWRQFIESGNAPASVTIGTGRYAGKVAHDINNAVTCCGGTFIANTADNRRVRIDEAIIDGATYGCSDYLGYQDHD